MRRSLTYLATWTAVTTLAVSLSWLGVRHVLRGTMLDGPGAAPVVGPVIHASPSPPPTATITTTPRPMRSSPTGRPAAPRATAPRPHSTAPANIHSYGSRGGRAAFEFLKDSARLVSATPNAGYSTKVTRSDDGWLRVDFTSGPRTSSIIASWFDHPPMVQVYEY